MPETALGNPGVPLVVGLFDPGLEFWAETEESKDLRDPRPAKPFPTCELGGRRYLAREEHRPEPVGEGELILQGRSLTVRFAVNRSACGSGLFGAWSGSHRPLFGLIRGRGFGCAT